LGASQLGVFASLIVNRDRKAAGYPSALLPSRAAGVGLNKTSARIIFLDLDTLIK